MGQCFNGSFGQPDAHYRADEGMFGAMITTEYAQGTTHVK